MQDDLQNNNNTVNGIGLPPALQTEDNSSVTYPSIQSPSNDQTSSAETASLNIDSSRTPLNSVSSSQASDDTTTQSVTTETNDTPSPDKLLDIKRKALQQLQPLVDRLDLSPEEKFNTTMMMIQASDDQTLINKAFDAAQQIGDEKDKAQALLDIVNEINYFTHGEEVK